MRQRLKWLIRATRAVWCWLTQSSSSPRRPIPWRDLWRLAMPLWLVTRLLMFVLTYLAQTMLRARSVQSRISETVSLTSLINSWRLWDGGFYGRILVHGYRARDPITAGFFPLYPLLAKPLELVLGSDRWQVALLVVSNLATLAALALLGAFAVQEEETLGAARRAMLLLLAAPLALFLTAAYSDSLFLALTLLALLCARRGQWRVAALAAFFAALARPVGIVLVAPLLWEYGRAAWQTRRVTWTWDGFALAGATPAALALYSAVCWRIYGDPLQWVHSEQRYFQHVTMTPWSAIGYAWRHFWSLTPGSFQQTRVLVDYVPLAFVLVLTLATIRRIPASFTLLMVGILLTVLMTPVVGADFPEAFVSAGRYLLPSVPVYLILTRITKRYAWLETALVAGGFAFQALLVAFVLTGGWLV
jgi:mannosyltransferase PIG-V